MFVETIIESLKSIPDLLADQAAAISAIAKKIDEKHDDSEYSVGDSIDEIHNDLDERIDDVMVDNLLAAATGQTNVLNPTEESVLAVLNSKVCEDDFGSSLNDEVASSVLKIHEREFSKELIEKLKNTHKTPLNCRCLRAPKVNSQLWNELPATIRANDVALQGIQQTISRGLIASSKVLEMLLMNSDKIPKETLDNLMRMEMDAVYCQAQADKEMSSRRRALIKPALNKPFSLICNKSSFGDEFLFGDTLEQDLKNAQSTSRVIKAGVSQYSGRYGPYPATNSKGRGSYFRHLNFRRPLNRMRGGGQSAMRGGLRQGPNFQIKQRQ